MGDYLAARLPGRVSERIAALIYERSGGNPLFMVAAVEHLTAQGLIEVREGVLR